MLKKQKRIISKVKSNYWARKTKYGFSTPRPADEAKDEDARNGNTLLEMKNTQVAFEEYDGEIKDLVRKKYQEVRCHLIFDIKLGENLRRKARLVAGSHTTKIPSLLTYASVVSRDSVCIALTIAALNDLDILACDIQNAYLTAPCREKIFTKAGPEFGSLKGKYLIITRALYGLKSSGAVFRALLAETLSDLGYKPSYADQDVWMRPAVKSDGTKYYEYVLCYVDDVLCISANPAITMNGIRRDFKLKGNKAEEPTMYLGAGISKMTNDSGDTCWAMSSEKYCTAAIQNVEDDLKKVNRALSSKCYTPL